MPPSSLPNKPRVLITGALGRLAGTVTDLLQHDFACHLTDKDFRPDLGESYTQADLTDFSQVYPGLVHGADAVAHFAIASKRELSEHEPAGEISVFDEMTMKVNLQGTHHIFEAVRRAGVRKIVYLSSMTVYLGVKDREVYDQNTPLAPNNLYACTKLFGENLADLYFREHGISVICLRIGQPYPANPELDDLWRTSKRARTHFVAIQDVAEAVRCALATEVPFGIFNVVSSSDNPRVDLRPARAIGYYPRYHFCDDGLRYAEDGIFPPCSSPIVTSHPSELSASS